MNTTISMWLGIVFLVLGVAAVLLQAWLWNPKYWDEEKKVSHAPRLWMNVHRGIGFAFLIIYVVMMVEMIPRLWEYQFELPARTVIHAVAATILGVLLITKIAILRFFRHFEEAMPTLGMGVLICTVVLATLSFPFAIQAHDISGRTLDPENIERTQRLLTGLELEDVDVEALTTATAFGLGRAVLVESCVPCHDIRTILQRPRTAGGWHSVVTRMQEKPIISEEITDEDAMLVTAYLIAITPNIQRSSRQLREEQRGRDAMGEMVAGAAPERGLSPDAAVPDAEAAPPAPPEPLDESEAAAVLQRRCTECHGYEELEEYGGADEEGWGELIHRMVIVEAAEVEEDEVPLLRRYLAQKYPAE